MAALVACQPAKKPAAPPPPPPPPPPAVPTPAVENDDYPDFPDPFALLHPGSGYLAASTNATKAGDTIQTRMPTVTATSLGAWESTEELLQGPKPNWVANDDQAYTRWWAPAVWSRSSGTSFLYFTARDNDGRQCIGGATAATPAGPFAVTGGFMINPVVCDSTTGSIDPSVFVDTGGQAWLLWKRDGNCCNVASDIWARRLGSNGLPTGAPAARLIGVSQAWEFGTHAGNTTVEGPSMAQVGADYYLFYSGSDWHSSKYAVGYAKCSAPTGGCTKPQDGPILATGPNGSGPGGGEVFVDHGGQRWLAHHAWNPGKPIGYPNGERRFHLTKLELAGGPPLFGSGP